MKHMACGKAALLGVFALAGCYSYASEAINGANYNTVQASPNFVVLKVGDSDRVILRLINDNDNGAITSYTISGVGAGIRVDSSCIVPNLTTAQQIAAGCNGYYRPIFDASKDTLVPTGDKTQQQFFVVGLATGQYTFTATPTSINTGISRTVTVVVSPITLGPALSKTTAVAGDTVVVTAPTGSVFSQTSAVTFQTGVASIVTRAADSTTITLIAGSDITGPATVTKVGLIANPAVPAQTLVTSNSLTTPALVAPTISPTTQVAGGTVVLTAAPNTVFSQTSAITTDAGPTPPITARSADSTTISFIVGPGDSGAITVTSVGVANAPVLGVATLVSSNSLNLVPPITVAPSTVSNLAPNIGVPITVQLGVSLRFLGSSHVFIGGREAGIQSLSADSSTATIVPMTGSTGIITYTNIALSFLTSVPLSVPGDKNVTVSSTYAGGTDPNATDPATATAFQMTGSQSFLISDAGPFVATPGCSTVGSRCRFYKLTNAQNASMSGELRWDPGTSADLGIYVLNAAGTACAAIVADDNGSQSGGPEADASRNCSFSAFAPVPAGTLIIAIVTFNADPVWFQFRISQP